MELFILLGFFTLLGILLKVFFYRRKKKQAVMIQENFQNLKRAMDQKNYKEALIYIQELIYNPHLNLEKIAYIKHSFRLMSETGIDSSQYINLKNRLIDKENSFENEYYGIDG